MSSISFASSASSSSFASTASSGNFVKQRDTATFMLEKTARGFGMEITEECKIGGFTGMAGAAEVAGIEVGSHVRRINGRQIAVKADVLEALKGVAAGDEVSFEMELPRRASQLRRQDSTGLAIVLESSRERQDEAGKSYTVYTIHVDAGKGVKWDTEKRYSEFRELKTRLIAKHAGCAKLLPEFPSRVSTMSAFVAVSKKQKAAETTARRLALEVGFPLKILHLLLKNLRLLLKNLH